MHVVRPPPEAASVHWSTHQSRRQFFIRIREKRYPRRDARGRHPQAEVQTCASSADRKGPPSLFRPHATFRGCHHLTLSHSRLTFRKKGKCNRLTMPWPAVGVERTIVKNENVFQRYSVVSLRYKQQKTRKCAISIVARLFHCWDAKAECLCPPGKGVFGRTQP